MKIFFPTRTAARSFTKTSTRKVGDNGTTTPKQKRWFVAVK